jgi:hypothetical protein
MTFHSYIYDWGVRGGKLGEMTDITWFRYSKNKAGIHQCEKKNSVLRPSLLESLHDSIGVNQYNFRVSLQSQLIGET